MRRSVTPYILVFVAIMAGLGWSIFHGRTEFSQLGAVRRVESAPSRIHARLLVRYDSPPVVEEEYRMSDIEGISTYEYRIRTDAGRQTTITAPPHAVFDVSFFFGKIDQLGVWNLMDKPPRGNTAVHYTIYVKQYADFQHGDRTITFTDPHYWATTGGRQFHIDLSQNSPRDLLRMSSTTLMDPRYEQIIAEFRKFGPQEFKERVEKARASAFAAK